MRIPTQKECFRLIRKMEMMDHIVDHSVMVSRVSLFLCRSLKKEYPNLNTELVTSAALLHDITKTRSFTTGEIHSDTGGKMLSNMGYPEVGEIIRQHVVLDEYSDQPPVTNQEIVNYSDKRVLHDRIVSLNRRLMYIERTYVKSEKLKQRFKQMRQESIVLESKLFRFLTITPSQLSDAVLERVNPDMPKSKI